MANPNKIPVFEVVAESYRFAFGRFVPILTATAVPFIVLAVAEYFLERASIDAQLAALSGGRAPLSSPVVLGIGLAMTAIQAVLIGVVAAALHRMVLFGEPAPRLRFGAVEQKFIGASLVFSVVLVAPSLLIFLVTPDGSSPGAPSGVMLAGLSSIALLVLSVFLVMVFPIIVAEGKIDPARSVALVSGNWWRIVGMNILATLPLILLVLLAALALGDTLLPDSSVQTVADMQRDLLAQKEMAIPMAAVNFVTNVIVTAVGVGILSYSYKALNGQPLTATLTETPPV